MPLSIRYPSWIRPEIISGLPFRWYGLMYAVAFVVTWLLFRYESRRRSAPWTEDESFAWFFWAIVGLVLGARIVGCLVYDPSGQYLERPWLIFWPFGGGRFTGFQGLSFHGGLAGMIVATLIYCKAKRMSWLPWVDVVAVCAPLGYTAGRLGNFINGELWGKVTGAPWGMIFPNVPRETWFGASEAWVQEIATEAGLSLSSPTELVNLPRHPSQLYEALFEGLVLWLVMWLVVRKRKGFPGFAASLYAIGYGAVRFVIEYFREPDYGLGYALPLGDPAAPTYRFGGLLDFSMGQVLCALMIAGGALMMLWCSRASRRAGAGRAADRAAAPARADSARKLRKRIK
jgi:phosphatidylglycerol---prolipoprotein diacylglyceryl transferase